MGASMESTQYKCLYYNVFHINIKIVLSIILSLLLVYILKVKLEIRILEGCIL